MDPPAVSSASPPGVDNPTHPLGHLTRSLVSRPGQVVARVSASFGVTRAVGGAKAKAGPAAMWGTPGPAVAVTDLSLQGLVIPVVT